MVKGEADSMLKYAKKASPTDAKTYYQSGNDFYEKGDYEKAIENYNMAILLNPVFSEAYFNRALSYYQLKNFDKSVADYTKSAELDPQNPIIYNNRGDAYYRKQDFQSAIKDYDKAIQLNPNYLKAFYNRGLSYASLEEYEKAIDDFTKVVELKADFAEAYHLRGLAYEYAGNIGTAITDYEKALELNPNLTEAKTHLEGAKAKKDQEGKGGESGGSSDIKMLQKPDMTFVDVAGMEKMKEEIREAVVYPMINPELARKYGKLGGGGILMYGPPGCGKCVSGDTSVLLSSGELKSIKDIYEQAKKTAPEVKNTPNEFIIEDPAFEILSLNKETLKIERKKVNYAYKQKYKGKLYEVVTRSGRRIKVTPEHPFITIANKIQKIKAQNLSKGMYVAVPNEIQTTPPKIRIENQLTDFTKLQTENGERLLYKSKRSPAKMIKPIYDLDEETAEMFGYLLSEGSANPWTMTFHNSDQNLINKVSSMSKGIFGITPRIKPDTSEGVYKVEIGSAGLIKFLEQTHGFKLQGSRNTRVPISIMRADKNIVYAFLSAVFESEATVRKDVPEIEFITASAAFANELAYLLLQIGIVARIRQKRVKGFDHIYWRLYISDHNQLKKFESKIGFKSERKIKLLERWTSRKIDAITNVDIIPNIKDILKKARKKLGMNKSQFYGSKNGYRYELYKRPSRALLSKILSRKPETEEIKLLRKFAESNVLWDEVVEIKIEETDDYVYDLTVDDNHTFIAGLGGIVVHNTFVIKAAAGECKSGFINAKLSDLLDMYVGNTEKNIHKVFELARKNVPCMLFFDEVDAIGGRRDQQEGQQYMKMAVNQLLYEMDGVEAHNENVLVIAATNAPWDVDPALRRSGRFSKTIYVPEPDFNSRIAILKLHAKRRPLAKGIPFTRLGMATTGYASADLKAIVDEAATFPWKEAFFGIKKKTEEYVKQGLSKTEAEERAKKEVKQRPVTCTDFIRAIRKKRSSLPPWYGQAKKQIGKQEEVTIIDGKEHKKVTESKLGPAEKDAFSDLLKTINSRNQWHNKAISRFLKEVALIIPVPF